MKAKLFTDGACFHNPGPMGLGVFLQFEDKDLKKSIPFGTGTNNIAEYSALIKGLELALQHNITDLIAHLDSQLVVKQVNGDWKVKDTTLQQLHKKAQELTKQFNSCIITWIPREQNSIADNLSKQAAMIV